MLRLGSVADWGLKTVHAESTEVRTEDTEKIGGSSVISVGQLCSVCENQS